MQYSIGEARSMRDQCKRDFQQMAHRLINLEAQYNKVQGTLQTTLQREKQIQKIKEQGLQSRAQKMEHSSINISSLNARKQSIAKTYQDQRENIQKSLESVQQTKKLDFTMIKNESKLNHKRIEIEKHRSLDQLRKIKEHVQAQEEISRQNIHNWMLDRMRQFDEANEQQKQIYLKQQEHMLKKMDQMEKYENMLIHKLQESQRIQNEAADRLQSLYTSYYEQNKSKIDSLPPISETQQPRKTQISNSQSKLFMYTQPLKLHNPASNKIFKITNRQGYKQRSQFWSLNEAINTDTSKKSDPLSSKISVTNNLDEAQNNEILNTQGNSEEGLN